MTSPIQRVFFELLQHRRASPAETRELTTLKHNSDLCPGVQRQCEQVLRKLERHQSIVYDVQGPADSGVDVLVVLNEGDKKQFICFQVKASYEATAGVYEKLKAQWADAKARYADHLLDYYILLAWDEVKHRDKIRVVEQSFAGLDQVHVIEPGYLAYFLTKASPMQLAALTSTFLNDEDPLEVEARRTSSSWTARQLAVYVEALARRIEGQPGPTLEEVQVSRFAREVYESSQQLWFNKGVVLPPGLVAPALSARTFGDPWEHLLEDVEALGEEVELDASARIEVQAPSDAVLAISYSLKARHEPDGDELRTGIFEALTPLSTSEVDDIIYTLIQQFTYSVEMEEEEAVELFGEVIRLNLPALADRAEGFGLDSFDPENEDDWQELAEHIWYV